MIEELRTYIDILEYYAETSAPSPVLLQEDVVTEDTRTILREQLESAVFKLRSYSESSGGEYALGFEQGLEMAAEMVENILRTIGGESGS